VGREYPVASKTDRGRLREFLSQQGQVLLPMVELIEQGRLAVEELGGAARETV